VRAQFATVAFDPVLKNRIFTGYLWWGISAWGLFALSRCKLRLLEYLPRCASRLRRALAKYCYETDLLITYGSQHVYWTAC